MQQFEDGSGDAEPVIIPISNRISVSRSRLNEEKYLGQFIPLVYHYNMLQDETRVSAFRDAINLLVQPGMSVIELGAGTGILSALAARRGARVTGVERNPELVQCADRLIRENGLADRVSIVAENAEDWVPDHPVDVVICEMLHVGLLREKQAQVITAFKRNYKRKFGSRLPIFVPETSILLCQPIQQCFDFEGYVAPIPMFQAPLLNQPRTRELSPLQAYETVSYDQRIPSELAVQLEFEVTSSHEVNAIRLVTQNVLAIDVPGQRAITWPNQCLVLPLDNVVAACRGTVLDISLKYSMGGSIEDVQYSVKTKSESVAERSQFGITNVKKENERPSRLNGLAVPHSSTQHAIAEYRDKIRFAA